MADGRVSGRSVAQDPDVPLGLHVIGRLKLQTDKGMSAARTAQTRVGKASKNTATDGLEQRRQRRWASEHPLFGVTSFREATSRHMRTVRGTQPVPLPGCCSCIPWY